MRGHPDLDGPSPFVHHLVDADLEELVVPQRPGTQHHPMVEVICRAGDRNIVSPGGAGWNEGWVRHVSGDTGTPHQQGHRGWVHHINGGHQE